MKDIEGAGTFDIKEKGSRNGIPFLKHEKNPTNHLSGEEQFSVFW
jgi:hypothetical protein